MEKSSLTSRQYYFLQTSLAIFSTFAALIFMSPFIQLFGYYFGAYATVGAFGMLTVLCALYAMREKLWGLVFGLLCAFCLTLYFHFLSNGIPYENPLDSADLVLHLLGVLGIFSIAIFFIAVGTIKKQVDVRIFNTVMILLPISIVLCMIWFFITWNIWDAIDKNRKCYVERYLAQNGDANLSSWRKRGKGPWRYNWTLLMQAAISDRSEIAQMLLQQGADINAATEPKNETALHFAVRNSHINTIKVLLENKATVRQSDIENAERELSDARSIREKREGQEIVKLLQSSNNKVS
jgi:hypothetical protein